MLVHACFFTCWFSQHTESQLVNKQNEYYRMRLQVSYLDIYGLISV